MRDVRRGIDEGTMFSFMHLRNDPSPYINYLPSCQQTHCSSTCKCNMDVLCRCRDLNKKNERCIRCFAKKKREKEVNPGFLYGSRQERKVLCVAGWAKKECLCARRAGHVLVLQILCFYFGCYYAVLKNSCGRILLGRHFTTFIV